MDKRTIEIYDKLAESYDTQTIDFWERFPTDFLQAFTNKANSPVLDLGCGPGRDGLILKKAGLNVLGLDASANMVKMSLERGLPAVIGDALNLPFPDASFGGIWSYTTLLHLKKSEIQQALQETYRVLKPGGVLALGMMEGTTEDYRLDFKDTDGEQPRWFAYYAKEELEGLLNASGYTVTHISTLKPKNTTYLHIICEK